LNSCAAEKEKKKARAEVFGVKKRFAKNTKKITYRNWARMRNATRRSGDDYDLVIAPILTPLGLREIFMVVVALLIGIPMFMYKRKVAMEAARNRDCRDMGDLRRDSTRMRDV